MIYTEFGKTGYTVSRLGFGAMRLPTRPDGTVDFDLSTPLIRAALQHGVNFIDSHHFYHNGQSEEAIGRAIEGFPREKLVLQTKIGMYNNYTEQQCWKLLEEALVKMKTDYIDFYLTHSLSWDSYQKYNKLFLKFTQKALDQKLIRRIGFSVHDTAENMKKLVATGEFSAMTVQYNLFYRDSADAIALANEKGMGVVIMGPVAGGMLGGLEEEIGQFSKEKIKDTPRLALRFVLANPNVHIALSGMSTISQVEENARTVSEGSVLSREEIEALDSVFENRKKLLDLYCTGCRYCLPCPNKVQIPSILHYYNLARVYGVSKKAREGYFALNAEERASSCLECGECEKKCPQKIPISKRMKEIAEYFEKEFKTRDS
jgi:hypothetical protein